MKIIKKIKRFFLLKKFKKVKNKYLLSIVAASAINPPVMRKKGYWRSAEEDASDMAITHFTTEQQILILKGVS